MAAAVARRYGERFFELVGRREGETADDVIAIYRSIFRQEIERDGRMCLNGMLGAEAGGLPPEVVDEIETYFRRCIDDLSSRIGGPLTTADFHLAFLVLAILPILAIPGFMVLRNEDGQQVSGYRAGK